VKTLEDLRDEPLIGEVAYRIDETTIHPLLFHDFAHTAYYLTVGALQNFEDADAIGSGPYVVPAIAFWFMALESYISTIYKACLSLENVLLAAGWTLPFGTITKTDQIADKTTAVKRWIVSDCAPSEPVSRLREFATFRNKLFHDLTEAAPRTTYSHTFFSPKAEKCNQVDLMEALNVSLETFGYFRHVFAGTDLMPSIMIGATSEKLDVLVDEVVRPTFAEVLIAKGLHSEIKIQLTECCPAELLAGMQFLIRSDGPTAPCQREEGGASIVSRYMERAIRNRPIDDDKVVLPNYAR
jgi:hypothetical protein